MEVHVYYIDTSSVKKELEKLFNNYDRIYMSVAWATVGEHFDVLIQNSDKIKKITVGISFFGTDPQFLEVFLARILHEGRADLP